MELDKNGVWIMSIWCLRCSGGTHSNMNEKDGKGRCYLTKKYWYNGHTICDFKCKCGYVNHDCSEEYVKDYAI